ncbi:MAG: hypothetical protein K9L17_00615 [Clostridiales bacterium]|nr:hypothetical protein [Clostridiales bacterium]MCF8021194.1 hypothetical protein [Clostridiales bacterium]
MHLKGIAKYDVKTKDLVKRLESGDIAIINHSALDEVAALSLIEKKIKAVINVSVSLSRNYPNPGPLQLIQAGIPVLDNAGEEILEKIKENQVIEIVDENVLASGEFIGSGDILNEKYVKLKMQEARYGMDDLLSGFVSNTLDYAHTEIGLISGDYPVPEIKTSFKGKHALIVVRGKNYKGDLMAIKSYVKEMKPVLIGVDGGADALMEFGFKPDIIVGDMDSVSDKTLRCGAEIVVHAYADGKAPGLERIYDMKLYAVTYPAPGTSEDIAMLMAYDYAAELIVAVGTHSNMMDFLEKGRKGMASTFLVRMKVGSNLVDARGVSQLYRDKLKFKYLAQIFLAALLPVGVIVVVSPSIRQTLRLLFIQFRMLVGI